jgi:restriction system protein
MQDASWLERFLFNWFSRRNDFIAAVSPIVVFFVILGAGLPVLAAAFHERLWPPSPFFSWVLVLATIAALGLYLTTLLSFGAVFVRSRRFKLLQLHQTMRDIQAMSWREFEDLVVANYAARGYDTDHVGSDTADGGVDVVIRKGGKTWLVQCKHYRSQWVNEKPLRELLGLVSSHKAAGGIFVTCGVYDDDALAFAKANPTLELIGGEQLRDLVREAVQSSPATVLCPVCGSNMRAAHGRYGPFLGCVNFPACKGWRPLPEMT